LTITQGVTNATGTALATLNSGTDPTDRTITVTATAGTAVATLPVSVTGTSLSLSGPANLVLNNSGSYDVLLTNSSGQAFRGVRDSELRQRQHGGAGMITTDGSGAELSR